MKYVKYSINELMAVSEDDFISALFEHTQNRPFSKEITDENEKIDSWEDCLSFLCVDVTDDTRILDCTMVLHVLHDHNMLSLDDSSYSNILRIMV